MVVLSFLFEKMTRTFEEKTPSLKMDPFWTINLENIVQWFDEEVWSKLLDSDNGDYINTLENYNSQDLSMIPEETDLAKLSKYIYQASNDFEIPNEVHTVNSEISINDKIIGSKLTGLYDVDMSAKCQVAEVQNNNNNGCDLKQFFELPNTSSLGMIPEEDSGKEFLESKIVDSPVDALYDCCLGRESCAFEKNTPDATSSGVIVTCRGHSALFVNNEFISNEEKASLLACSTRHLEKNRNCSSEIDHVNSDKGLVDSESKTYNKSNSQYTDREMKIGQDIGNTQLPTVAAGVLKTCTVQNNISSVERLSVESSKADGSEHKLGSKVIREGKGQNARSHVSYNIEMENITANGKRKYECNYCSKRFNKRGNWLRHERKHSGEWPYTCDVCDKRFPAPSNLIDHKRSHSDERPYTCDVCDKGFIMSDDLIEHKRTHSRKRNFFCDVCNKRFNLACHLMRHKMTHSVERPYICDVCNKSFNMSSNLKKHQRTHSGEKPYICDVCDKGFNQSTTLIEHKKIHSEERPYICDVCHSRFYRCDHLEKHKRTHSGERPYICDVCHKGFAQTSDLNRHKKIHSGERSYTCDVCDKGFIKSVDLITHKRTHNDDKPFICDVCDKRFNQSSHLTEHKRTHSGERPYICDTCSRTFNRPDYLMEHKRTHSGDRPYKCDVCDKTFNKASHLIGHKRTHSGEKPFICDVCDKRFTQSGNLVVHKRTHSGERPYICDICNKGFTVLYTLKVHKKTHSKEMSDNVQNLIGIQ